MAGVKNSLVQQQQAAKPKPFSAFITQDAVKAKINQMIGGKDGQRFITAVISAVSTNPALAECDHSTILSAAMLGESLKLSPSPQLGQYYMVPFKDKKRNCPVATFVLGYKGYLQLAIRSGYYRKINVLAIKEGELVNFNPLTEEIEVNLIEDEEVRENTPTCGYYAMFEYNNGFRKAMYWSKKKMMLHADKYSQAFSMGPTKARDPKYNKMSFADYEAGKVPESDLWLYSSFWYKSFDDMSLKTMLRQLISKWGIMSIEMQTAFERDESLLNEDGSYEYIDNTPEEPAAPEKEPAKNQTIDTTATEVTGQTTEEEFNFFTEQQAGA
jgi:recombination protein RecT